MLYLVLGGQRPPLMVDQQVWRALVNVPMRRMHAQASAVPRTRSVRRHATRNLVSASANASIPAPLPCYSLRGPFMVQQVWRASVNVPMLKMHAKARVIPETRVSPINQLQVQEAPPV